MATSLPPKPYARIRIAKSDDTKRIVHSVPLRWLQDWRLALNSHRHIAERLGPPFPAEAGTFLCFYSPHSLSAEPAFHAGIRNGTLAEWNSSFTDTTTVALFSVHVVNIVREARNPLAHLRHALVRLVSDRTELMVPVSCFKYPHQLRLSRKGVVLNQHQVFTVYYAPNSTRDFYDWGPHVKSFYKFREHEAGWYEVNVLRVFESEYKM